MCPHIKTTNPLGVVIKQSSISGIVTYLGAFIGFVNSVLLFPAFLSTEELGLIRVLPNIAFMLLPLVQLGTSQALLKFSPEIKKQQNGLPQLLGLITLSTLLGAILMSLGIVLFKADFVALFETKSPLVNNYIPVIVALIFIVAIYSLVETYSRILLKIIAMNLIREILLRILTGIAVLLYFYELIDLDTLVYGLILIYGFCLMALIVYLMFLGELRFSFRFSSVSRELMYRMANFSLYSIIGASGAYIVLNIDQVMVTSLLGLDENGIYSTSFYFAVMIELSKRPILQITTPLISQAFENNRLADVQKMHRQLSINLMIIASLFFVGIVANLDNIYALMPNGSDYSLGRNVIIIIGISKLIDMTFANNSEIIVMSRYYRFNVVSIFCLSMIMVVLNSYLIPIYGMDGAAMATLLSISVFNLVKMTFLRWKLNITPFSISTLKMLGIFGVVLFMGLYLPYCYNTYIDLMARSGIITITLGVLVLGLRISPEANGIYNKRIKPKLPW
ncbi:Membrane protein involved in the export of O-antigen and teichoic acid [Reichenbachiella agariperforans]|uniref:Membrane protein involved in the export of O-antigen and teichoic acid n=1 Tax=Reichenbachiella agariperforans TaxID=156994 RepID=A0A1M6T3W5_REIAG|nr:Membrane protein involved in the export of O-antigen and teichoic acid [Reichenbachiella agariperforans]